MIQTHTIIRRKGTRAAALLAGFVLALSISLEAQAASSWKPTLLVNTESFQTIDEGDSTTNIELKFGDTLKESLFYNRTAARFQFTRSLYIQGDLTATGSTSIKQVMSGTHLRVDKNADIWGNLAVSGTTLVDGNIYGSGSLFIESNANITGNELVGGNIAGSGTLSIEGASSLQGAITAGSTLDTVGSITTDADLTINQDNGAADAVLTFGNDAGAETLKFNNTTNQFELSDDLAVTGALSASGVLSVDGTAYLNSSEVVTGTSTTSGNIYGSGSLFIESNANITGNELVGGNIAGSGTLSIEGASSLQGAITAGSTLDTVGTITTDADLTINHDNGAADAVLTFGNDAGAETLKFNNTTNQFELSDDLAVTGALSASGVLSVDGTAYINGAAVFGSTLQLNGVTYTFPYGDGAASGRVLKTDGAGNLSWATDIDTNTNAQTLCAADEYLDGDGNCVDVIEEAELNTFAELQTQITDATLLDLTASDNRYVNRSGDTMTGALQVRANISGSSLRVDGNADIWGTLGVSGAIKLNGQSYTFPTTNGDASQVLTTDGDGTLSWSSKGIGIGSGGVFSISPEYPDAVYTASGSAYIGQLTYDYDATNKENYYRWTSSKAALQDYWIVIRVRVPDNYSAWDNVRPIQFRYRTTSADTDVNSVSIRMLDTAGNAVALTGGEKIAATDWTTATVTGSEAAGTYTPGSFITVFVKVVTTVAGSADAGFINLNWETTAP